MLFNLHSMLCSDFHITRYALCLTVPPISLLKMYILGRGNKWVNILCFSGWLLNHACPSVTHMTWYHAPKFLLCWQCIFSHSLPNMHYHNMYVRTTMTFLTLPNADTTDVQSASVEVEGDNVTITCTFLSGSNAQGCNVVIRVSSSPTPLWTGNISRDNNSNTVERIETIELPDENNYLVSVHDLEADGSVGQTALSATVNVISTITSASQGTSKWSDCVLQ